MKRFLKKNKGVILFYLELIVVTLLIEFKLGLIG